MAGRRNRGNGEGCISRRKDGSWCAVVTTGRNPETGKLKRRFFYGKTRQEVADKLNQALADLRQGTFVAPSRTTVGSWLSTWLEEYKRPKVRPSTLESYRMMIDVHIKPGLGHIQLKQLQPCDLQRFYNQKLAAGRSDGKGGLSPRMVRYMHVILHGALKQAVREGLVARNVAEAVELPREQKKEFVPLTDDQVRRFLSAIKNDRLYAAFLLDLGTGLRRGELLALRWQDVDLKNRLITVRQAVSQVKGQLLYQEPKSKKSQRTVPIPESIATELKAHKARQNQERLMLGPAYQDNGLVFCQENGEPLRIRTFLRRFDNLLAKAGVPKVRFHDLRHTFATLLLQAGEHPKVVSELLGHSCISITLDTYTHVLPELKQAAAARLDGILNQRKNPSQQEGQQ